MKAKMRIWKYPVISMTEHTIPGRVIHFAVQDNVPHVWCEVAEHPAMQKSERIRIEPTGASVPDGFEHFMTLQNCQLVWHLYVKDRT